MKRLMVIAALVTSSVSCVPDQNDSAVRLLGAVSLNKGGGEATEQVECSPSGDIQVTVGSLDISAISRYLLALRLESRLQPPSVEVDGVNTAGESLNDVTFTTIRYKYNSSPQIGLPTEETQPIHFVLRANADADNSFLVFDAFTSQAITQLGSSVGSGTSILVEVKVKLLGRLGSGQSIETNEIGYPIHVYGSGFVACPTGFKRGFTGPCGLPGGQDGTPLCIKDDSTATP